MFLGDEKRDSSQNLDAIVRMFLDLYLFDLFSSLYFLLLHGKEEHQRSYPFCTTAPSKRESWTRLPQVDSYLLPSNSAQCWVRALEFSVSVIHRKHNWGHIAFKGRCFVQV